MPVANAGVVVSLDVLRGVEVVLRDWPAFVQPITSEIDRVLLMQQDEAVKRLTHDRDHLGVLDLRLPDGRIARFGSA